MILFTVAVLLTGMTSPAAADEGSPCSHLDNSCEKTAPVPGHVPGKDKPLQDIDATAPSCVFDQTGATVPCTASTGIWSNAKQCYLRLDPAPQNTTPTSKPGAWYLCHPPEHTIDGITEFNVWIDGRPLVAVNPGQLARQILARLQLRRVGIGITPTPGHMGVLGLPTYLWVIDPGPHTLGPISDSATAGGVTVTLTARVDHVVWDLGDGTTITCTGPGTPYQDSFGAQPSPTCGHTYAHPSTNVPGGAYPVTATAVWDVAWTGGGQAGAIPFDVTSRTTVRIGEVQALN
jgi:hypothetical protein